MAIELGAATQNEVGAFYFASGEHTVLRIDGEAVALGAVRSVGERVWVMLDLAPAAKDHGFAVVRAIRRYFAERNQTVYAVCGFPAAGRLLHVLGFAPTEETVAGDKRVWRWLAR